MEQTKKKQLNKAEFVFPIFDVAIVIFSALKITVIFLFLFIYLFYLFVFNFCL